MLSIRPSVRLSVCPSVRLSVRRSVDKISFDHISNTIAPMILEFGGWMDGDIVELSMLFIGIYDLDL